MALPRSAEITGLLRAWSDGDPSALDRLASLATALVNEVYLRLVDVKNVDWQQRAQFFAITSQMMRRILVDAARARGSHKRGAGAVKVNVDDVDLPANGPTRLGVRQILANAGAEPVTAAGPLLLTTDSDGSPYQHEYA